MGSYGYPISQIIYTGNGPVSGAGNFFVTNVVDDQGVLTNTSGTLTLSSSTGLVYVSGNLTVLGATTAPSFALSTADGGLRVGTAANGLAIGSTTCNVVSTNGTVSILTNNNIAIGVDTSQAVWMSGNLNVSGSMNISGGIIAGVNGAGISAPGFTLNKADGALRIGTAANGLAIGGANCNVGSTNGTVSIFTNNKSAISIDTTQNSYFAANVSVSGTIKLSGTAAPAALGSNQAYVFLSSSGHLYFTSSFVTATLIA